MSLHHAEALDAGPSMTAKQWWSPSFLSETDIIGLDFVYALWWQCRTGSHVTIRSHSDFFFFFFFETMSDAVWVHIYGVWKRQLCFLLKIKANTVMPFQTAVPSNPPLAERDARCPASPLPPSLFLQLPVVGRACPKWDPALPSDPKTYQSSPPANLNPPKCSSLLTGFLSIFIIVPLGKPCLPCHINNIKHFSKHRT